MIGIKENLELERRKLTELLANRDMSDYQVLTQSCKLDKLVVKFIELSINPTVESS